MSSQHFLKIIQGSVLLLKNYTMEVSISEQIKLKELI
jgi:hypothetical protein